jgi:outer membrane protein W
VAGEGENMRHIRRILWVALAVSLLVQPALAQDRRFALRFGIVGMSPTGDSTIDGSSAKLESAFGAEVDFEWYINQHLGLEASLGFAADTDVKSNDNLTVVSGVTLVPATIGLNGHIIRSENVDWYIGILGGVMRYGDFDFVSGGGGSTSNSNKIDSSGTFGAQTAVDIAFGSNDRWAINIGIKYLESELEPENSALPSVRVDPLSYRALAVFRF